MNKGTNQGATMKKEIKIHNTAGNCITLKSFCEKVAEIVSQTPEMVEFAMSFILDEQGLVEAMETYCAICGIETY